MKTTRFTVSFKPLANSQTGAMLVSGAFHYSSACGFVITVEETAEGYDAYIPGGSLCALLKEALDYHRKRFHVHSDAHSVWDSSTQLEIRYTPVLF